MCVCVYVCVYVCVCESMRVSSLCVCWVKEGGGYGCGGVVNECACVCLCALLAHMLRDNCLLLVM